VGILSFCRTDRLRASSTVMPYIADSYSGCPSFVRPLRVSAALIAQYFEQLFFFAVLLRTAQ
jgi:hypothetical protein